MNRASVWPFLVVAALSALMVGTDLGARILSNNDEARFAVLARDLLTRGDWLHPRLNGDLYLNKPPLLVWLIAVVSWPVGQVTQLTAALPSAAAGVLTAFVIFALGRDLFGPVSGAYAALIAVSTQGLFLHARLPLPDMLMTAFITASVWMLWRAVERPQGRSWIGVYGFAAAAFWAKGPAGFLPLGVAVGWALARPPLAPWTALRPARGLLLLAALVAPWWLLGLAADAQAMRGVVLTDHLGWYAPSVPTVESFVDPIQTAVIVLVPWVLFLPPAVRAGLRLLPERGPARDRVLLVLLWAGVVFALLALAREQRVRYYLPLIAPTSLLVGWWWAGVSVPRRSPSRLLRWALAVGGALLLAGILVTLTLREDWLRDLRMALPASATEALILGGGLVLIFGALVQGLRSRTRARAFVAAWAGSALLLAGGYHCKLARRNAVYDYPGVLRAAGPVLRQAPVVVTLGFHQFPMTFYFGRPVLRVETEEELLRMLAGTGSLVAIVPAQTLPRLPRGQELVVVARERLAFRSLAVVARQAAEPPRGS